MVKVREVPPTVDSGQLLAGAQFVDAFSLEIGPTSQSSCRFIA